MNHSPESQKKPFTPNEILVPALQGADGAVVSGPPAALTVKPSALALLKALKRRWLPALCLGVLAAGGVGTAVWFIVPPAKSTARSLLNVSMVQQHFVYNSSEGQADFATYQRTQAALVKSRDVLDKALSDPKVKEISLYKEIETEIDPIQWLEKHLQADYSLGPEILRVSMSGDRPQEMATLVNAVVAAYMREIVNKEFITQRDRLNNLKILFDKYEDKTRVRRQNLRDVAEAAGSGDVKNLALRQRIALEELARGQHELTQCRSDRRKLEVDLALQMGKARGGWEDYAAVLAVLPRPGLPISLALAGAIKSNERYLPSFDNGHELSPQNPLIDDYLLRDTVGKKQLEKVAKLEAKIAELKRVFSSETFMAASENERKELQIAQDGLDARRRQLTSVVGDQQRVRGQLQTKAYLARMQERLALITRLEKVLDDDVQRLDKQTRIINKNTLDVESLREEIALAEGTLKKIATEMEKLEVERQAPPRVKLREEAVVYRPDANKMKVMASGGAGLAALGLVLFGFGWAEFRSRKVASLDEVVHGLGMRLIGTLPDTYRGRNSRLPSGNSRVGGYGHTLLTESIDAVRTMLLHTSRADSLRILMVTSAMPGEGKTSLASHLATSLARAGRNTLLVDGDLRNPSVHKLFGMERTPGFSELLRCENTVDETLQPTDSDKLWILPAGQCTLPALQGLAQDVPQAIFDQLRQRFDFIIIDTSPVLPVPDALLLGQYADGSLFSILHNVSRLPKVYAAYQRLEMLGIRMLGAVVNGAGGDVYEYSGYGHQYAANQPES